MFGGPGALSVSELTARIQDLLQGAFPRVRVTGELSNVSRPASKHVYFTLKDESARLRAVCYRSAAARVKVALEDGMMVVATGRISVYPPHGQYQLVADTIEPAGEGEFEAAFRRLKEKLEAEGLFAAERKRALPRYPRRIGVVTSATGAAVRDVVSTLARRWPCGEIFVSPSSVQGVAAPDELCRAIRRAGSTEIVDVLIVARGGGSIEDLHAFNTEAVARAVAACAVPVVSGVGHETDFTIVDFVADRRAPTPTGAAEMVAPEATRVLFEVVAKVEGAGKVVSQALLAASGRVRELLGSYALGRVRGRIETAIQRVDTLGERLQRSCDRFIEVRRARLVAATGRLDALNPHAILERGYAICTDPVSGGIIRSVSSARRSGTLRVHFSDGGVLAEVTERVDEA